MLMRRRIPIFRANKTGHRSSDPEPVDLEGDGGRASATDSRKRQVLITNLREWFSNTSLHGARYFIARKLHWSERIWWLIAYSVSLCVCSTLIRTLWCSWTENPIVISFSGKATGIENIPFPAVTICPRSRSVVNKLNFTKAWLSLRDNLLSDDAMNNNPLSKEEYHRLKVILLTCSEDNVLNLPFEKLDDNFENETIYKTIKELAPTSIYSKSNCSWMSEVKPCPQYLRFTYTEEGLCYSFNVLNSDEIYTNEIAPELMAIDNNPKTVHWNPEQGYDQTQFDHYVRIYPHRAYSTGIRAGFGSTLFFLNHTADFPCSGPIHGFKVILHGPNEIPQISKNFFHIPSKSNILISIRPNMIITDEQLVKYSPDQRQCFFNSERILQFFRFYNQRNCELECLANFTKSECGCVPFYMPRDNQTRICGLGRIECWNVADDNSFKMNILRKCNCLPSCRSVSYGVEISHANIHDMSNDLISQLSIAYKEHEFISSIRSELYSQTDFIANCGGLLGLFTGVSLLSIVEMIYYCTLRLGCALSRQRTKFKNRNPNIFIVPHKSSQVVVSIDETDRTAYDRRNQSNAQYLKDLDWATHGYGRMERRKVTPSLISLESNNNIKPYYHQTPNSNFIIN